MIGMERQEGREREREMMETVECLKSETHCITTHF